MESREENSERVSPGFALTALFAVVLLPLIYVLSIGPVARLVPEPPNWLEAFYLPVLWAAENSEVVKQLFEWYMNLWGAK